jgi:flagellar hook-length control protein FliK
VPISDALPATADGSVSLLKPTEPGARASEQPAQAQRFAAVAPVAPDLSDGGDGTSQNGAERHSASNTASREIPFAARSLESADVSTGLHVFAPTSPEASARPAATAAVIPAQTLATPQQDAENVTRLVESMRVQWRQGVPEATVRLRPEHLGEVTISIRVERGVVSAVVHAETPAVQQWLESQEDKLRNGLADQGLSLERFVVRERQQEQRREQRQHQPPPRFRQPKDDGPRFEVSV